MAENSAQGPEHVVARLVVKVDADIEEAKEKIDSLSAHSVRVGIEPPEMGDGGGEKAPSVRQWDEFEAKFDEVRMSILRVEGVIEDLRALVARLVDVAEDSAA